MGWHACVLLHKSLHGLQAQLNEMTAAHASALSALTARLDAASKTIACLEQQLKSGQGELAEMEARVRSLHHELQVWCNMHLSILTNQITGACHCQLQYSSP